MQHPHRINCLVVEDEPLAARILEDYIRQLPWLHFAGRCADALAAAEALQQAPVDLLFLDIHLPGMKGLDFLRTLTHPPQVILTTAFHQYALESYDIGVVDYLLKPIEFDRFLKAVQKAGAGQSRLTPQPAPQRLFRFFNVNKKMVRVWVDEIRYAESLKEYMRLWLAEGKTVVTKLQMSELEQMLEGAGFLRVHRSFLVAIQHVDAFSSASLSIEGKEIPVGRQYRDVVQSTIAQF